MDLFPERIVKTGKNAKKGGRMRKEGVRCLFSLFQKKNSSIGHICFL